MKKKFRLIFLVSNIGTGGQERQLSYLLANLDQQQYPSLLFIWNNAEKPNTIFAKGIEDNGVQLNFLGQLGFLHKIRIIRKQLGREEKTVVHAFSFYLNFVTWLVCLAKKNAVPFGSLRSAFSYVSETNGKLTALLSSIFPKRLVSNNKKGIEEIKRFLPRFIPKTYYHLPNGIPLPKLASVDLPLEPQQGPFILVGIGSLKAVKRWDLFIHSIATLKGKGYIVQGLIAGEGPLRAELASLIQQLDVMEEVLLLGHIQEIQKFLASAHILVHTSDSEGFPNAVMEGMMGGLPIVATDTGDIRLILGHTRCGFLVPAGNLEALTSKLEFLLERPTLISQYGKASRKAAEQHFDMKMVSNKLINIYEQEGFARS